MSDNYEDNCDCLIIKYKACYGKWDEEIYKCFILNKLNADKFKKNLINELKVEYPTSGGYDCDYAIAKLIYMEKITIQTYNIIQQFDLTDDESGIINLL